MQEEIAVHANNPCENNGQLTEERLYETFRAGT